MSPSEIEDKEIGLHLDVIQEREENDSYDDVYVFKSTQRSSKKVYAKKEKYPRNVINWTNYVSGNDDKPRKPLEKEGRTTEPLKEKKSRYAPTLISESKAERARNKPVVPALVEGKIQKTFSSTVGVNVT